MKKVLIVDDSKELQVLITTVLKSATVHCETALNGKVACDLLMSGYQPSLIFLDLSMPVMNGHDFLTWKKSQPAFSSIPVVIVSSEPVAQPEGAVAFIRKPFTLSEMLETFQAHSHS